jgi:hypothetical protein
VQKGLCDDSPIQAVQNPVQSSPDSGLALLLGIIDRLTDEERARLVERIGRR